MVIMLDWTWSMQEWMSARPDVCQARDLIHRNPVDALAPVAAASFPPRLLLTERQNSREVLSLVQLSATEEAHLQIRVCLIVSMLSLRDALCRVAS